MLRKTSVFWGGGKVAFGLVSGNWVGMATKGEKPFDRKYDLRTVVPTQMGEEFFITLKNSPINSMSDLRGKRVSVGLRSSGMDLHAQMILGMLGITYKDIQPIYLGFGEGASALRDGNVAAQLMDGLPNPSMTELSELADVKVIKFSEQDMKKLTAPGSYYSKFYLEKGVFRGVTERITIIANSSGIVTLPSTDPELTCSNFYHPFDSSFFLPPFNASWPADCKFSPGLFPEYDMEIYTPPATLIGPSALVKVRKILHPRKRLLP